MAFVLPKNMSKREFLKLRKKWMKKLKDSGFEDSEYVNSSGETSPFFIQTSTTKSCSSSASFYNKESTYQDTLNFYVRFSQYCEENNYKFSFTPLLHWRNFIYFSRLLQEYLSGVEISEAYARLLSESPLGKPASRIYYYKKIQLATQEFLRVLPAYLDELEEVKWSVENS